MIERTLDLLCGGFHTISCRIKENNARLTRQLEDEKRALKAVQENLKFELNSQTELEKLIRVCVEDVRKEIARRYELHCLTCVWGLS
jgi:glucose-6-phosphate-specific signal transduction histidine kinase